MSKQLVTVMGATGNQGGSLIHALLNDGNYKVRAVTRNPSSPAAQSLAKLNVEVVKADANNKAELLAAFKGSHAVFGVTNFWDKEVLTGDHGLEERQGRLIVDAAAESKVAHFLWSSLPYVEKISKGKYSKVIHFDGKARVAEYIKEKKLPATFIEASFYMTNFVGMMPPHKNSEGVYEFVSCLKPDSPIAMIDIPSDFGKVALGVIKKGVAATLNKEVKVAGEYISFRQVAQTFELVTGRKAIYKQIDRESLKNILIPSFGPVIAEEFIQMLEYFDEFGYFNGASIQEVKEFNPNMTTFKKWLETSKWKGPE